MEKLSMPIYNCFCCICKNVIYTSDVIDRQFQKYEHRCNLIPSSKGEDNVFHLFSFHERCYSEFLNSFSSDKAPILHSIICYHLFPNNYTHTCPLKSSHCKCTSEIKFVLKHMEKHHIYRFCVTCRHVYRAIREHASTHQNHNSRILQSFLYNEACFVPFCSIARRELAFSDPNFFCAPVKYNSESSNFRYFNGAILEINDFCIGNLSMNLQCYQNSVNFCRIKDIGKGSNGTVTLARTNFDRYFAIKKFHSKFLPDGTCTSNESTLLSSISHPNIVHCFGGLEFSDFNVMFIEYTYYSNLDEHIDNQKGFSSFQTLFYLRQLASALEYLHCRHILHRDVKDENVLLFDSGYICKLCDFSEATYLNKYIG